jgi:phosphoenolpyruvate-protein kinase (PTS system EI component)
MDELKSRGQPFNENIPVGTMIEVPSAAETIDLLAAVQQAIDYIRARQSEA